MPSIEPDHEKKLTQRAMPAESHHAAISTIAALIVTHPANGIPYDQAAIARISSQWM